MVKRCVILAILDCSLEDDSSQVFPFPEDLNLLDQWLTKMPLSIFKTLNFNKTAICEHHFSLPSAGWRCRIYQVA
jgi:hypothetical protein